MVSTHDIQPGGGVDRFDWTKNAPDRDANLFYYYINAIISFLQYIFRNVKSEEYRWSDDEKQSKIIITDQAPDIESISVHPTIVVINATTQYANLSTDGRVDRSLAYAGRNLSEGEKASAKSFADLMHGTFAIGCLAKGGVAAEYLSWVTGGSIRRGKDMLCQAGFHEIGSNVIWTAETSPRTFVPYEVPPGKLVCRQVTCPYSIPDHWSTFAADPKIFTSVQAKAVVEGGVTPIYQQIRAGQTSTTSNRHQPVDGEEIPF